MPPEISNQQAQPTPQPIQSIPPQTTSSTPLSNQPPSPEQTGLGQACDSVPPLPRQNGIPAQHAAIASMQGHRPGIPPVPPGIIAATVSVDGLTLAPYALFSQSIGAPVSGAGIPPQPQANTTTGPSSSPRVQPVQSEGAPPPQWPGTTGIAPSQTHLNPPPPPPPGQEHMMHRPPPQWDGYAHPGQSIPGPSTGETYEYRYRDDGNEQWVPTHGYYEPGVRPKKLGYNFDDLE